MKPIFALFFLLFFFGLKAQEPRGYYVTLSGDTITTTYQLKTRPVISFRNHELYEHLLIPNETGEPVKLTPADIKSFYIEWMDGHALFVSMPLRNGKQKFFRVIALSPQFNIYGYTFPANNGSATQYALQKTDGKFLYVGPDDGNQKTKKRLKEFFAGEDSILEAMKDLFIRPGFVPGDMHRLIERIFNIREE